MAMNKTSTQADTNSSPSEIWLAFPGAGKSSLRASNIVDFDIGDFRALMNTKQEISEWSASINTERVNGNLQHYIYPLLLDNFRSTNNTYMVNDPAILEFLSHELTADEMSRVTMFVPSADAKEGWISRLVKRNGSEDNFVKAISEHFEEWRLGWIADAKKYRVKFIEVAGDQYLSDFLKLTIN